LKHIKILVVDDEEATLRKIAAFLDDKNLETYTATNMSQAVDILIQQSIDIAIIDVVLQGPSGLDLLKKIKSEFSEIETIMMSAHNKMEMVIEAMHEGAVDFIRKPFGLLDLDLALRRTKKYLDVLNQLKNIENKNSLISRELEKLIEKELIGISPEIRKTYDRAVKAANDGDVNVMILGENGTGKEIIARIIHYSSRRKEFNFTAVNCSAIPESLLESEFFGHKKGSFTDAKENKRGLFEMANGGTIFLDEIGDMPLSLQAKLLRTLEEGTIKQIGGDQEIKVDVRIISATNRNLPKLIGEKKFREDLYHRINVFDIKIPPLRERKEDIELLVKYFVKVFAQNKHKPMPQIRREVIDALKNYHFPGNVRELKNLIERAIILSNKNYLDLSDFSISLDNHKKQPPIEYEPNLNLEENEIVLIKKSLDRTNYNQNQAAKLLGISRDALIRRLRKYDIKIKRMV
jgi:DNA-binding NtrC family response regulator